MMNANEKGRSLEEAVRAIEEVILASSPSLREKPFKIEQRKIVWDNGVRHEIDILVTVDLAAGYPAIFVFECKNQKKKVDKNEILAFSKKVEVVAAQSGYFVAKSFTSDARAQARQDKRIKLLTATEHDPTTAAMPELFHVTVEVSSAFTAINLRINGSEEDPPTFMPIRGLMVRIKNREVVLGDYLDAWLRDVYSERLNHLGTAHLSPGIYPLRAAAQRSFGAGECMLNDQVIERIEIEAQFEVGIIHPLVRSHYEVATRGRVVQLEPIQIRDGLLQIRMVNLEAPSGR